MPKDVNNVGSTNANKIFDIPLNLQPGQVNTLAFSQDSISSMQMTAKGELEISFRDGSKVAIADFNELADSAKSCGRDTLIQLSDNTIIYPDQLRDQLAQKGGVDFAAAQATDGVMTLDEPKAGQILTKNIESGHEYKLGFNLDGVNAAQSGHNLLLTFKDGGVLVLNNYFTAVNSDLPPAMTLADGATIDSNALLTSCKLVEVPNAAEAVVASADSVQSGLRQGQAAPDVEPAAGEEASSARAAARDVAKAAPANGADVANIEPAAGGDANRVGSSRGYGFGSSIDGAAFGSETAIGPIGATALNYTAPRISAPYVYGTADDRPVLGSVVGEVDETHIGSVSGVVPVNFGRDTPGDLTLNSSFTSQYPLTSHGVAVVVALVNGVYTGTANGVPVFTLTLDPATGEYTFTQFKPLDHSNPNDPNDSVGLVFGVDAADGDGDVGQSTITINVHDDGPVAVNDGAFIGENQLSVNGNVLANDNPGADGLGHVTKVTFNGNDYTVPATGTVSVNGVYGILTIAADGSYTYTSSNTALGTDKFSYTMVDYDGDPSTANLTLEVRDLDTCPIVANSTVTLDETGVAADGTESVSGQVVVDFGSDAAKSIDPNGAFSSNGSLKGNALTSHGVPVTVTLNGDVYTGKAGDKVVFTLTINNDGTYKYTQVAGLDHADGQNPNDVINLSFGVKATDADGDSANGSIIVKVLDDAPVAVDDGAFIGNNQLSVNGNVLTNDNAGTDGLGHVTKVTFNGTDYTVPATGTVSVIGTYGTLTIGANGAYSYTSSNTALGTDKFSYTMVDYDGDPSTAKLTLEVRDLDSCPIAANSSVTIDETGVAPDGTESVSGKVVVDFGSDAAKSIDANGAFSSNGSLKGDALTSHGVPITVTMNGDVYTGEAGDKVIFTLTINDDGSYKYTQTGALDHADGQNPNDVINLSFGFKATDADGDSSNGTITVKVLDDAPVAVDDGAFIGNSQLSVNGNVLTNDNAGTDGLGHVTKVTFNGTDYTVPATGTINVTGAHGTLTIGANGAYSYTSSNSALGTDKFSYTMVDYDGDPSTANLTLEVRDLNSCPIVADSTVKLDETGIAADGTESVSGVVTVNFGVDAPGKVDATGSFSAGGSLKNNGLTSNGVPVTVTMNGDVYTGKAGDKLVFTLTIGDDGKYTYTQVAGLDHADGTNPNDVINLNFGFKATDADGDAANGTIIVKVLDDAPTAANDFATLASAPGTVTGNVLTNDTIGTDKPGHGVTAVTFDGKTVDVPATGTVSVTGAHGTLTIGSNGVYSYSGTTTGSDVFTYKIVDQDGDAATANLTVTVADIDTVPCVTNAEITIDETGIAADGTESVSGTVSVDFGADAAKSVDATGAFSAGGSLKNSALTSNGVPITVTMTGDVYTGKAGDKVVFTLTIGDDGKYTYTQVAGLDHADGTNPNDVINLNFGFKATDADGDSANGIITVKVLDDAPTAANDFATLSSAPGTVTGNVLTNDNIGTDKPGKGVTAVTFDGKTVDVPATGTVSVTGAHGTLTIGANGVYSYSGKTTGNEVFTYKIVDQDGDAATANLTITISRENHVPCITNVESCIDETGIAADGTESVSGHVVVDYMGDGAGAITASNTFSAGGSLKNSGLTSNGVPITVALANGTYTGTANGKVVFTLTLQSDGSYKYTQVAGLDHADGSNPNDVITLNFGFTATDKDGDHANGIITVKVSDDAPTAANDFATLSSAPGTVNGNVLTNDNIGTDKPGHGVTAVTFEGKTVDVPATGTVSIAGAHGTLTIGSNGVFSYSGVSSGNDVFTYKIVDQDGDAATANLTIKVEDIDTVPCVTNAEITIDETGITPDGTESVSGKVDVDFGADAAKSIDATGAFSAGGSLKNSALTSNGVPITVTMSGDVYTGKAGDKLVFTLTIGDDGKYTYTQVAGLDHKDANDANDVINLNFGFKATDADGDSASGTITVKVLDDAPVAHDDTFANVTKLVSGNVLTNDYQGTDAPAPVTKITLNGVDYQVAATGVTTIGGQHGVLTIKADGSYTYAPTKDGTDNFTYTIVDRDGDKSSAHLSFDVKDNVCIDLTVNSGCDTICVKEDGCAVVPVTAHVAGGDGNEVVTLTLTGVASSWQFSAAGWSQTAPGTYSITLPAGQTTYNGNFSFAPPANSDVDLNGLKITASVYDPDMKSSKTDEGHLNISVDAVADIPTLVINLPNNANDNPSEWTFSPNYNYKFFGRGESYAFNIHATPTDTDGSEQITHYTIEMHSSLAALGVKFSAGTEIAPGLWDIPAGQEVGLQIIFPEIHGDDGNPWTSPAYAAMQGIHTMNVTAYVGEVNLSGNECDLTDNTSFNCTPVQIIIFSSPLVIDLNGDGIHLTTVNDGVYFDINGDGITDKTAWVDKNDGFLVLDKNHNGQIDGQSELFGGNTEDGYAALARYDDNHDGVIDSKDAVWKDLSVWQDANHDGVTQSGELITLDHLDFASISLDAKSVDYQISGNGVSAESNITGHDGSTTQMVDAWFAFYNGADADQMAEAKANEAAMKTAVVADAPLADVPADQPVEISNFDSKIDKLDLSTLIDTENCAVTSAINDFVFSRTEGGNTIISVDASGSGSASAAVDVVVLKDVIVNHVDDIVQIAHQQQQQSGFGTV